MVQEVLSFIQSLCDQHQIALASINKESGRDQYEVALLPSYDLPKLVQDTQRFKQLMQEVWTKKGVKADFAAKPLQSEPGSGLHIHINAEDEIGNNLFYAEATEFAPDLLYAIGGLLKDMNASMPIFAPYPESHLRFTAKNTLCNVNAPTTLSWGKNNRSVAIRLPSKSLKNRHIEHRVAGSDADVKKVIDCIIKSIEKGIEQQIMPPPPVYGNASHPQYQLPLLELETI